MRCCYCEKNEALKTYERVQKGEIKREYYCLSCYEKKFLSLEDAKKEGNFTACPYCETTIEEYQKSQLLGCAHCYKTLGEGLIASIIHMQGGDCGHRGKAPFSLEESDSIFAKDQFATQEERDNFQKAIFKTERLRLQKQEVETLIAHLGASRDERAEEYKERLGRLNKGESEEEIVW